MKREKFFLGFLCFFTLIVLFNFTLLKEESKAEVKTKTATKSKKISPAFTRSFYNSLGVNTHIVYFDTSYANWNKVMRKIKELGISHLRDGVYANSSPEWHDWNQRYYQAVKLAEKNNIKFNFIMPGPNSQVGSVSQIMKLLSTRLRNSLVSIEAPNEYDLRGVENWPQKLRQYQKRIFNEKKKYKNLKEVSLIGPSLVHRESRKKLGDLSAFLDYGNLHSYPGGLPENNPHLKDEKELAKLVSKRKPLFATETGYHNALNDSKEHPAIPKQVAANYAIELYLENYKQGIKRTFLYQLLDQKANPNLNNKEEHFGLLNYDYSEKPAFRAIKRMVTVVGKKNTSFQKKALPLQIKGSENNHLLLQKRKKVYILALWNENPSYDIQKQKRIKQKALDVHLKLSKKASYFISKPSKYAGLKKVSKKEIANLKITEPLFVKINLK